MFQVARMIAAPPQIYVTSKRVIEIVANLMLQNRNLSTASILLA